MQRGQAIVLVALLLVVLFGFVGLALDGGRAYLDRRHLQASVDAASLAAAYDYMANTDVSRAEYAAMNEYATNERLYTVPTCTTAGTTLTCPFGDSTNHVLTVTATDHSIAGTTFTATATHRPDTTVMQVLGAGPTMLIGATATSLARRPGTNGAAVQTLSPSCTSSLTFSGAGTANIVGDVWSNGNISGGGSSTGSVTGNVVGVCSNPAPPFLPNPWTVSGSQVSGWNMSDPGYAMPPLNTAPANWTTQGCDGECPGTYATDPHLVGGAGCYFLETGVYTFAGGLTQQGGLISNELRPPDEPNIYAAGTPNTTTLNGDLVSGLKPTTISVRALPAALPNGSLVTIGGQTFTLSNPASAGAVSLSVVKQTVAATVPDGSLVSFRALPQFWDSAAACAGSFDVDAVGNTNSLAGTWSVEVTSVRWEPYTCRGQAVATPSCFIRESAPSMCKTVSLGSSTNIRVKVTATVPGAEYLNVYLAQNGTCSGLAYLTQFQNTVNSQAIINNASFPAGWPAGFASPPDQENPPLAATLPNSDAAAGTPPRGDLANESQCVDPSTGANVVCGLSSVNPGAVILYLPSTGCVSMNGGGDIYVFSGYQYHRVILFEPGPEQSSSPNTCANKLNGHDFTSFIGIFYVPAADITLNGTSRVRATIAGGLIAWTATVLGSENLAITADPSLRAWPPTVRLTQ
ncbi:MAG: hypothetical protein E6I50_05615 [Chloroflexi bacterium]|nr:MAG: hypothetical protein E6I50_05615 [Chloroflexota bacterium]